MTEVETRSAQLSPFGGLLGLVKFLDLVDFRKHFEEAYITPSRESKPGHYAMVLGILGLMFVGFNRIWHFVYIGLEPMLCDNQQGGRIGHNSKNRGEKGYRPVLC